MAESRQGRTVTIVTWVVSVLLAALFLMFGGMKLAGTQETVNTFTRYGYAGWFRVLIGFMEVGGGALLLVPRLALHGATVLGIVMIGAAYTHLTHSEAAHALVPVILLAALGFIGYARGGRAF